MRDLEDPTQSGGANCSKVEIREATAADADLILALHHESVNDPDGFDTPHQGEQSPLDAPADCSTLLEPTWGPFTTGFGWPSCPTSLRQGKTKAIHHPEVSRSLEW